MATKMPEPMATPGGRRLDALSLLIKGKRIAYE